MAGEELTFEATYLVNNIHCESCEDSCKKVIHEISDVTIKNYEMKKNDSGEDVLIIDSNISPYNLITNLQSIGKDAVLRGTSSSLNQTQDLGACVSILESLPTSEKISQLKENLTATSLINSETVLGVRSLESIRGIIRAIEMKGSKNGNDAKGPVWIDAALTRLPNLNGIYNVNIHKFGNLQNFDTLGPIIKSNKVNLLNGGAFLPLNNEEDYEQNKTVSLMDLVGRGVSICDEKNETCYAIGLWARSSGLWGNSKKICACSGKTIWEERKDALEAGIV
ncbi:hypothetical protein ACO0OE_001568 [Hanseniaspora uvarum]|jgi:copper chaperone for superoxide dismutase